MMVCGSTPNCELNTVLGIDGKALGRIDRAAAERVLCLSSRERSLLIDDVGEREVGRADQVSDGHEAEVDASAVGVELKQQVRARGLKAQKSLASRALSPDGLIAPNRWIGSPSRLSYAQPPSSVCAVYSWMPGWA